MTEPEPIAYVITASDRRVRSVLGAKATDGSPVHMDDASLVARAIAEQHGIETIVLLVRTTRGDGSRWIVDVESGGLIRDPAT